MEAILIVEDDAQVRDSLVAVLSSQYLVRSVQSGEEALDVMRHCSVDVVLLDLVLPNRDGFAVLGAVAGLRRRPHVIVLTVVDQVAKAVKAMRLGACDYLLKPCALQTVRAAVRNALSPASLAPGIRSQ